VSRPCRLAPAFVILFLTFSGYFLNEDNVPVGSDGYFLPRHGIPFDSRNKNSLCI